MVSERDRILNLKNYLRTFGVDINIGKTKARGNKGIFIGRKNSYRIDVSRDISEDKIFPVIIHEFVHYVHYIYDSSLKSLEFVFGEGIEASEELIKHLKEIELYFLKQIAEGERLNEVLAKIPWKNLAGIAYITSPYDNWTKFIVHDNKKYDLIIKKLRNYFVGK